MYTQDIIQPFLEIAQTYLDENRVREIIFSRGTYHVQVVDRTTQDPNWAFIQFDKNNQIQDHFCSCQIEPGPTCEHLASALLKIYNHHSEPLHKRFEHSFWKHLCFAFAKNYGYDSKIISQQEEAYQFKHQKELLFSIHGKTELAKKNLADLLKNKPKETEETSLKFSNLPKKELEMWKEGRPSEEFRFELSFWSDIAKWLMLLQEKKQNYKVKIHNTKNVPSKITIIFDDLEATFGISLEILKAIIPYFNTIDAPIKVHESQHDHIDKILYNPVEKCLDIYPSSFDVKKNEVQGVAIGDWIFHPKEGFVRTKTSRKMDQKETILSHHIDEQLEKNSHFFQKYLSNAKLDIKPIKPSYLIKFDSQWNLHIDLYLFEPGDMAKPHSVFFGKWIFIENKGFYRLQNSSFKQPSLFILRDKVSEFIHQYRFWFNSQKGFETHLATIQTQMNYQVNVHHQLIFTTHLSTDNEKSFDFGDWVYIQDQGFYTKARYSSPINHGQTIQRKDVGRFIESNQNDLEAIEGFFSTKCPIQKASVKLKVDADLQEILVEPEYHFYPEYQNKTIYLFDHYTYVETEGFFNIPEKLLLPKGFRKKSKILPHDQATFLALQFNKIKPFISYIDPRLQVSKDLKLSLVGKSDSCVKLVYNHKKNQADIGQIYQMMQLGRPYYLSDVGLINLNHPRYSWIKDLKENQMTPQGIELTPIDIIRIEAIDAAFSEVAPALTQELFSQIDLSMPKLNGFKTKLRPYQQVGLEWLWKLLNYRLSGILCDDMGLGKTLQALALIAAIKNQEEKRPYPGYKTPKKKFLIVCPTSVIYHWQDKLKEFFPNLKTLTFYGLNRSLDRFQQKFDVLLTSYGILRIDQKQINQYDFTLAIYDELQVAKNHRSLTYSALQQIPAKMKLGLTGTPIENNLRELKALLDLIVPFYLPAEEKFRDFFLNPIERDRDQQKITMLKKMIEPFILRRKKEDVLKDLPKKTEQLAHCEMAQDQAKLYQFYLDQSKEKLLVDLKDQTKAVPYIHVFALLGQLKQICNHPKTIDPEKYKDYSSGKWDLFVELLSEARESGQKVVVFSQYLNMLNLIEEHLKLNQIQYASIRGSTQNRHVQLEKFQKDPQCEVFVASLKAVGLGVDLTAASVVIHYDRWWNAARENQATDRVHRIGQQRGVQVFKLVTLNTLEESISRIISLKGKLMEDVVGSSDEEHLKLFSRQDLIDILQSVHKNIYENA